MTDRESVFSDQRVIDLLGEHFIALTGDDWYWRRQQDEIGEFHRRVTDQGPRGGGTGTRQGRYVFSADGQLLGFNNNRTPERLLAMLGEALEKWDEAAAASARAAVIPAAQAIELDPRYDRSLPDGVVVLRSWTRALSWQPDTATWTAFGASADLSGGRPAGAMAARDHLWLQPAEVEELAAHFNALGEGGRVAIPKTIALRLARFHLVDNTRGEPPMWLSDEVRDLSFEMQRTEDNKAALTGSFDLATDDGSRAFRGQIAGHMEFAVVAELAPGLAAFELRVLGLHEGQGTYTPGARPGAAPLAMVLELVPEPGPADRVPPQAARDLGGYWNAGR